MHKFRVPAITVGALGADFEQTVAAVGDPAAVRGVFFQPYQFKAKLGQGPLKKFHDIFVKYLTKSESQRYVVLQRLDYGSTYCSQFGFRQVFDEDVVEFLGGPWPSLALNW